MRFDSWVAACVTAPSDRIKGKSTSALRPKELRYWRVYHQCAPPSQHLRSLPMSPWLFTIVVEFFGQWHARFVLFAFVALCGKGCFVNCVKLLSGCCILCCAGTLCRRKSFHAVVICDAEKY
jgi:hypothetical protein